MRHGGSVGNRVKAHAGGGTNRRREKTADSVRRLTVAGRGASVSRTAGQHDDAEKAGDARHAKAGKAAGRPRSFPISHRRAATGGGNGDGKAFNSNAFPCKERRGNAFTSDGVRQARPKGGPEGRARYDEGSYGHRQQSAPYGPSVKRGLFFCRSTSKKPRRSGAGRKK